MFVAGMAANLPGLVQSIFSTGRRASELLLDLIYNILCKIPDMEARIIKHTNETIWIIGDGVGDIRKIYSYPSKVKIASAFSGTFLSFYLLYQMGGGGTFFWRESIYRHKGNNERSLHS